MEVRNSEPSPLVLFTASQSHRHMELPPSWVERQQCSYKPTQTLPIAASSVRILSTDSPVLAGDGTAWVMMAVMMFLVPQTVTIMAQDRGSVKFPRGRGKVALLKNVSVSFEDKF